MTVPPQAPVPAGASSCPAPATLATPRLYCVGTAVGGAFHTLEDAVAQILPDPNSMPRVAVATTAVENVRTVPLWQLADTVEWMLQRIIPPANASKAQVAAFDASL